MKRICRKCGEEKDLDEFVEVRSCRHGRGWTCKKCVKAYNKTPKARAQQKAYRQRQPLLNVYIACNSPHLVEKRLHSFNLLSKGEFMQSPGDIELEMVMCPDQDKAVTREACLDFSGSSNNTKNCQSCENFGITRKILGREQ